MGEAKKKRDAVARLAELAKQVDLAPLTNPEVQAAVLLRMYQKGLVKPSGKF